ncbi:MAG: capsule assembly Wzi family protein [Deltaproteobacteria bacterium]|nr:capsule assembly Wzi family protein [Deltaproteobacteria bacterium]
MKNYLLLAIFLVFTPTKLISAPWVEVDDIGLRADIQLLADNGIINVPITTYPLMWASIAPGLENIEFEKLTELQIIAFSHIKQAMKVATSAGFSNKISIYAASEIRRFSSFGSNNYEKGKLEVSQEYIGSDIAGRIQVNYRNGYDETAGGNQANIDGSYLTYKLGNWVIDLGAFDQWWGPGFDTSLIMSNNARPLPALSIRRNDSVAFETPWLSWIGPWTFTAQMAQLESGRFVADTKMWSSRATFKPYRKLELGLSWSYQWGGQGQPDSYSQFFRGLFGQTECADGASSCDEELETKLGNQLAGFDARWADSIGGQPYAFYAQTIGEDSPSPGTLQISDKSFLYGMETQFGVDQQRILVNLEYSDTQANCGPSGDTSQDCFYEHGTYQSGYRYYRRSIGSTYDNDAETWVLTLFSQRVNGNSWQIKFRDLKLNTNNRDRFPNDPGLGNSVSKVAEQLKQLDLQYQFDLFNGRVTVGGLLNDSSTEQNSDTNYDVYLRYVLSY